MRTQIKSLYEFANAKDVLNYNYLSKMADITWENKPMLADNEAYHNYIKALLKLNESS